MAIIGGQGLRRLYHKAEALSIACNLSYEYDMAV